MNRSLLILPVIIFISFSTITAQDTPNIVKTTPLSTSEIIKQLIQLKLQLPVKLNNSRIIKKFQILDNGFLLESFTDLEWNDTTNSWDNSAKTSFTYNSQNLRTEWLNQTWNNNMWENINRHLYDYTTHDLISNDTYQLWNGGGWSNSSKKVYHYNSIDSLIEYIEQVWTGGWANGSRDTINYYPDNNRQSSTHQIWGSMGWDNSSRDTYQWDSNNRMTEDLGEGWFNNHWGNVSKVNTTYDPDSTTKVLRLWHDIDSSWYNDSREILIYNAGDITKYLFQQWNNGGWWDNLQQELYEYDANHNQTHYLLQYWDSNSNQWTNSIQYEMTYNQQNLLSTWLYQAWNNGWENYSYNTYTYDADNNLVEILGQVWNGSDWVNAGKTIFTWIPATGIDDEIPTVDTYTLFNNYPNPFNPSTTIKFFIKTTSDVSLKVFDVLGSEVAELVNRSLEKGSYEVQFTPKDLSSGVYFYKLDVKSSAGKKNFTDVKKMILMK